MRVGYIGNLDSPNARVWIDAMRLRGVNPVAIGTQQPKWDVEWAPVSLRAPRVKGLGTARRDIARQVGRACQDRKIDLLHTHEANRMSFWARGSGFRPRVITCWGSDVLRLDSRPLGHRLGVRLALASADAVTVGSRHLLHAAVSVGAREAGWESLVRGKPALLFGNACTDGWVVRIT